MVGSTLFSRPLGGLLSKKNGSMNGHQSYEEILIDDDEEEYYEEVIVDEDGEEYIEEIIEDAGATMASSKRVKDDLLVTQEQVDAMSFQNAKSFLMALPTAKGPTLAPTKFSDDDYEYEEIEMPDHIAPIRRSQRFSLFEPPDLDLIMEESSERSDRSGANSIMSSPAAPKRKVLEANLSNISEGVEKSPGSQGHPSPARLAAGAGKDGEKTKGKVSLDGKEGDIADLPEGTILLGDLNDTPKPVSSTRSIDRSNKSLQSEGTDTTYSESGSNTSLDLRQVFGTPPVSPEPGNLRKRPGSARRASEGKEPSAPTHKSAGTLGGELSKLGDSPGHSSRRRSSGSSRRGDDDDDDNRSTRSGKSRRSSSGRSGSRRSSTKSVSEDRAQTVEKEILQLLSPEREEKTKKTSLEAMLSPSSRPRERGDSDNMSRSSAKSSRSSARRRSSKEGSSDKSQSTEQSSRRASRRTEIPTKEPKKRPTLKEGSKTLDDLLARIPSEPGKRSDAKSTASGVLRSSRGRTRDTGRDSQSVVGGSSSSSSRRPARARSARRTKKTDDDDVSVASMPAMGRKVRSRSSSVGRKERLRRGRQRDEADKANRRHQQEMKSSNNSLKDEQPNSQRSNSSARRPSSSRSRNNSVDEDEIIEPGSRSREDKLRTSSHHSRRASNGRRSGSSDGRRPRSSSDRSSSSKASHDEPRSARTMDGDGSLDEMDGNASFSRTLMLARSLHSTADDDEEPAPRTPTKHKSLVRASSGGTRSPGDSHVRRSPAKTKSADDLLLYDPDEVDERHSSRLSSVAGSMRDSTHRPPKTPTKDKDRRREPPKKQHSSDDVLLVPELASTMDKYDLDEPTTSGGSKTRRPPSRSQSGRHKTSSSGKQEHGHTYHSPRRSLKAPTPPSTTEKFRVSPARSQSDRSPKQASQIRQAGRRSDFKSSGQSSSFSSPTSRRKSMEISPTKSPHAVPASGRRSSMDMGSSTGVDSPPLGGGAVLTPFERLSELEKIKTFLTEEEYERKKKEILACI